MAAWYKRASREEGRALTTGQEWLVDVSGCDPERLRSQVALAALFEELVVTLGLHVLGQPQWHVFPGPAGVTGLALLAESHLAVHTFPEHGFAALNVYCCRVRPRPDFESLVVRHLGAQARARVRELQRGVTP